MTLESPNNTIKVCGIPVMATAMDKENLETRETKKDFREILADYQSEIDNVINELRGKYISSLHFGGQVSSFRCPNVLWGGGAMMSSLAGFHQIIFLFGRRLRASREFSRVPPSRP